MGLVVERHTSFFSSALIKISSKRLLLTAAGMVFFWAIFDSFVSYFTPILITENGFSNAQMGLIYASSSVFGALFDFVLTKSMKKTQYRRVFLLLFLVCAGYPMILWGAKTLPIYIFAMALWGLYYDLFSFAQFDFVSKESAKEEHASSFSLLGIFKSMGYLVGPLVAGGLAMNSSDSVPSFLAQFFLFVSFFFLLALILMSKKADDSETRARQIEEEESKTLPEELHRWQKVGRRLVPVLTFTVLLYLFDAVYWTIGPLLSEEFPSFADFGGLFIVAATVPGLITVWLVGNVTGRFGKKRTAYVTFLISCLVLFAVGFVQNPYVILVLVFVSSLMSSVSFPSILGAYADYMKESRKYHKEIMGVEDFAVNIGYVLGPMVAGFLSGAAGNLMTFSYIAVVGAIVVAILLLVTPREIDFHDRTVGN